MEIFRETLLEVVAEAPSVKTFHFSIPQGYSWHEGAHLHLAMAEYDLSLGRDPNRIRHMSIATLPREGSMAITTRLTADSPFKRALAELRPGATMQLFHIGSRLRLRRKGRPLVLLSNGVGLAAFRPLILEYLNNPEGIPALHSFSMSRPDERFYEKDLAMPASPSFSHDWFSRRDQFHEAYGQEHFKEALFYLVGSELFLRDSIYRLRQLGVADDDMILDKKPPVRKMFFSTLDLITATPFAFK